jgi:hypothetical protein
MAFNDIEEKVYDDFNGIIPLKYGDCCNAI